MTEILTVAKALAIIRGPDAGSLPRAATVAADTYEASQERVAELEAIIASLRDDIADACAIRGAAIVEIHKLSGQIGHLKADVAEQREEIERMKARSDDVALLLRQAACSLPSGKFRDQVCDFIHRECPGNVTREAAEVGGAK